MSEERGHEGFSGESTQYLSQQYGGVHSAKWVDLFPRPWIPYIQLVRLSPPIAPLVIYLPHFCGAMHAARIKGLATSEVLHTCLLLLGGSLFYSNAAHIWNDLIDAPIDRRVARTKTRPIARGDITPKQAFIFAVSQALCAFAFLLFLPRAVATSTIPSIIGAIYYPWAKLHSYFPQFLLGAVLAWGAVVGASTLGIEKPWTDAPTMCLVMALALWNSILDTIYTYQDIADDERVGIKNLAILFKENTKSLLWFLFALDGGFLIVYGVLIRAGSRYYLITAVGCISSLAVMIAKVDLQGQASCWRWFSIGFWSPGAFLSLGLLFEYVSSC
ncbi:UbiA prenyltransferase [Hypoxylon trugodes]|uniref:UbiA prenyltransferase n=1 Tax=Hypoxylon trugodes TaxID=326681 RepID=UPI00218E7428|nr:UbiA prenyltransferase [Hypoxylon trugodes]KAI1385782.1 UbiA prenyltransferase [Hypoxylon trugodes]